MAASDETNGRICLGDGGARPHGSPE